jgi:DNA-directed RNA polymerase specialized sigma24 family protein
MPKGYSDKKEKKRYVPTNWPEPTAESLALFHSSLTLADFLTQKYINLYYFPGYSMEDVKQEILISMYKSSLFFKPEKGVKFSSYVAQGVRNRIINIMRNEMLRIHTQNDGSSLLNEDDAGVYPINSPKYLRRDDRERVFEDEKEIMEEVISKLSEEDLKNLNKLRCGKNRRSIAAATRRCSKQMYRAYHKVGKKLERDFRKAGMSNEFNHIVDYLLSFEEEELVLA